nr:hypothetical protein [Tanacetum cinerariifolium]
MLPVAPPSPDYVPGPEEPQTPPAPQDEDEHESMFIQPHDPDFMPEPIYPEYIPLEDEHVLPVEEQLLPLVVSPTTESPEYVAESDPEEDPKEYGDDETEDGPVDYPMDEGDDGDDDDGDSSGDDADNEDEDEEEHLASADSAIVIPTDELRLARCTTPAALPSPPLPPLHTPPHADRRHDIPKTEMPPRNRLCLSTLGSRYERVDLHMKYMIAHQETVHIVEEEAYDAREAWAHSIRLSQTVHSKLQTHREQASGTDGRDSPSNRRHETRDGRHAGRVASITRAAEES